MHDGKGGVLATKVLIVTSSFFPKIDGSTRCVYDHARKLAERKNDVYLVTRSIKSEKENLQEMGSRRSELFDGIKVFRTSIPLASSMGVLDTSKIRLLLEQILIVLLLQRKMHFDVIHVHGFSACFAAIPCKLLYRIPLILTTHGSELLWPRSVRWKDPIDLRLGLVFEKLSLIFCDAIVAQSLGVKQYLLQFYGKRFSKRIRIIHTGVDHLKFKASEWPGKDSKAQILFAGALSEVKGLTLLMDAFAQVHSIIPASELVLVGTGPSADRYKSYAKKLGLQDCIQFIGAVRDDSRMIQLYQNSDVVVLPSNVGGPISCTILEGLSSGRPVISTNVPGGIPDVINSEVGALIERNDLKGLTTALVKLLKDREYAMKIGSNARAAVERYYTLDSMIDRLETLYEGFE